MQVKMEPEIWNAAVDKAQRLNELWDGRVTKDFHFTDPKIEIEYQPKWPSLYMYDFELRCAMRGDIHTKRKALDGTSYNFRMGSVFDFSIRRGEQVCSDILSAGKVSDAKEIYLTEEQNHRYMALLALNEGSFDLHEKTLFELREEGKKELECYADDYMANLPEPEVEPEKEPEPEEVTPSRMTKRSLIPWIVAALVIVVIVLQFFF